MTESIYDVGQIGRILKRDVLGRVQSTRGQREALLETGPACVTQHPAMLRVELPGGALFVFTNKRRRFLKIIYWDGTGLWLLSKRLEQGTFSWPAAAQSGQVKLKLTPEAFSMLTDSRAERDSQPTGCPDGVSAVRRREATWNCAAPEARRLGPALV